MNTNLKHTPGPWKIVECQNPHEAFAIEAEDKIVGWVANSLDQVGEEFTSNEDSANTRLFAAAPELLAAAQHALDMLTDLGIDLDGEDEELIAGVRLQLDEAIVNAT